MPRENLTDRALRGLSTDKSSEEFFDERLSGFGVRVTKGGRKKTFFVRYRLRGRQRRYRIGQYPLMSLADARSKARMLLGDVERGVDPAEKRAVDRAALTFGELSQLFLERHAKVRKRTWSEDQRVLEKDLLPIWAERRASEVRKADVLEMLDTIVDRGSPIMANRTLALTRKIYNFALSRDLVEINPCHGLEQPGDESSRERVLNKREIVRLWRALDDQNPTIAAAVRLMLLTAQRASEVLQMREEQIEEDRWLIPGEFRKGGREHLVPLSAAARAIVEAAAKISREAGQGGWLLPSPRTNGPYLVTTVGHVAARIRKRLGFYWTLHDLRRTAATWMPSLGVDRFIVQRVLGHSDSSVTARYDRYSYLPQKREALEVWAGKVSELVAGR